MNENFINAWVSNVELERTPFKQKFMALRRQQGFKPFDKMSPLAQAIMKGWKKNSPSDSLVISPELELMGRLPVNERSSPYNGAKGYLLFLQESLAGKRPGLREASSVPQPKDWDTVLETAVESGVIKDNNLSVRLTYEHSEKEILSVFRTSEVESQGYTLIEIDTTAFKDGGVLTIDVWVGESEVSGSFDLFDADTTKLVPDNALASVTDIPTNQREVIKYPFDRGGVFKLGAIASAKGKGKINGFLAKISVEPGSAKNTEKETKK